MDVFNKLKSSLTSTVNEISAALPGNPLLREYEAGSQISSYGPCYMWKIYSGVKKSSKQKVAIFVFEKRKLEEFSRGQRELVLSILKKGVAQLTKIRHPKILTVEHALEESRDSLVFCTEPIFASLGNVLGSHTNIINPPSDLTNHVLHDVEIKYGLLQLSEALSFLHTSANMMHGNLCPESVLINESGSWKLAGFDFCEINNAAAGDTKFNCLVWDTTVPIPCLPNPNYLAVEVITKRTCDTASDMFSLGMLLYSIYFKGKTLYTCNIHNVNKTFSLNEDKLRKLAINQLHNIPTEVREHVKMLLHPESSVRPDADQMTKLPFFDDISVATLLYLDTLLQRDNLQKSQFFKNLSPVLEKIPKRVALQWILPQLVTEFPNHDMIPFVLPNVFTIAESCTKEEFLKLIFQPLIPVFKVQSPVQVLMILLQKMDVLLTKTSGDLVRGHILPMLANALSSPSIKTQELCLTVIPNFAEHLDFSAMKNSVIPRIKKIVTEGGTNGVRINSLVCLGKILSYFDKWFVIDEVLSSLYEIKIRDPGILMAILGVFKTALGHPKLGIPKEVLANKVIPFLLPCAIDNNLNYQQFQSYMATIKEMLDQVEKEQGKKLEQLGQMKREQASTVDFEKYKTKYSAQQNGTVSNGGAGADIFSSPNTAANKTSDEPKLKRHHLTLEEKQQLAKTKDQEMRMKEQGPLKPKLVSAPHNGHKQPKDLTSSLMSNTFVGINLSKSSPQPAKSMNIKSNSNLFPSSQMSAVQSKTTTYNQPQLSTSMWQQSKPISASASVMQNTQSKPNSSLDNLLSMPSQSNRLPMSQIPPQNNSATMKPMQTNMMMSSQPMNSFNHGYMQQPNNQFQTANPFFNAQAQTINKNTMGNDTKPLSNSDILDFLG